MEKTVAEIAKILDGEVVGDGSVAIKGVSGIKEAKSGEIAFVANPKYISLVNETGASAIITSKDVQRAPKPIIRTENPSLAFARVVSLFAPAKLKRPQGIHPSAVIPLKFNSQVVTPPIITNVLAFASFYIVTVMVSTIVISAMGYDMESSFGAVVATLGNIGPGIGAVGPAHNYAHLPVFGKWFLSFLMLIGRLELFTVLLLFTRSFWKK